MTVQQGSGVGLPVSVANGGTSLATLTTHALYVGAGTSAPTALSVGATNTVLHGNTGADPSFAAVSLTADVSGVLTLAHGGTGSANGPAMPINTQSGTTYSLQASDNATLVRFTNAAASTVTWPNPATVAANWWCVVENALTGTTGANQTLTHNTTAGTIDGFASGAGCTYVGSQILGISDGSNIQVILLRGGFIQLLAADSPFTYKTAIGAKRFFPEIWAGGGSGGAGLTAAAGGARAGGSAGGGGACVFAWFRASDLGSSVTCTIAAAQSTVGNASGVSGTVGNNTTFGSLLTAYGGGAGFGGTTVSNSGGAGGGWLGQGGAGSTVSTLGGGPSSTNQPGQFGGGSGNAAGTGTAAAYGGAAGGGANVTSAGAVGSTSIKGGPGGGAGGSLTSGNIAEAGGNGGGGQGAISGGGASGGNAGTSAVAGGSPNAASQTATALGPGLGGGGGGSGFDNAGGGTSSAGGAGGDGGIAAGGGGGGASKTGQTVGNGGKGGPGLTRIWDYP